MSKKARIKREPSAPFELTRRHVLVGIAVAVMSAVVAIGIVTYFGGSSLSKGQQARLPLPTAIGPGSGDRSAAADLLASKSWDDKTADERTLDHNEFNRVFDSGAFRFSTPILRASDVYRSGGHTQITRNFTEVKTSGSANAFLEALTIFCPLQGTQMKAYRYSTVSGSGKTEFSQANADSGQLPWDPFVYNLDWSSVKDLGFAEVAGHRTHGLDIQFSPPSGRPPVRAEHWLDVETAQLLNRLQHNQDGTPDPSLLYTLDWRQFAPPTVPDGQPRPACVDATEKAFGGP